MAREVKAGGRTTYLPEREDDSEPTAFEVNEWWRICIEDALGAEPDPEHGPAWAKEAIMRLRDLVKSNG